MVKNRLSANERRAELKEYLNSVGPINLNKSELARRYKVTDKVIAHDLELLISKSDPEDLRMMLRKFDHAFQLALDRSLRSLNQAQGIKEVNDSIRTLILVVHEHLLSLSRLGYKIDEEGQMAKPSLQQFNFVLDWMEAKKNKPPGATIPADYEKNITGRPRTSPGAQASPLVDDTEEDDLEPIEEDEKNG